MPKNRSQTNGQDDYHEFIKLVAQQNRSLQAIRRTQVQANSDDISVVQAQVRRAYIDEKWKDISERDEKLLLYESLPACATEEYFTEDFLGTSEHIYLTTCAALKTVINAAMSQTSTPSRTSAPGEASYESSHRRTQVPKIKLPKFSGNYVNWIEFRDHFQALIINDPTFDSFHRLYYLKSCLEGDAATLLKNLSITAENFDVAWKMLTERFENKRRLLAILLNDFFALKTVSRDGSPGDLRRLLDSAQECLDALAKLGRAIPDDIRVHDISQRLDRDTREAWEFSLEGDGFATFEELERFLKQKIRSLEAAISANKQTRSVTSQPRAKSKPISSFSATTHHVSSKEASRLPNIKCVLCSEAHSIHKCAQFSNKSVPQRWETVRELALCNNCLSSRHTSEGCRSGRTCSSCQKRHHSLLHSPPRQSTSTPVEASTSQTNSPNVDANLIQSHLSTAHVPSHVILSTAWVLVTSVSQRVIKLRALLDPGSTHTFISRTAAHELRTKLHATSMRVNGIGLSKSSTVSQVVPVSVSSVNNTAVAVSTDALVLDNLTSYVPKFRFPLTHWPHLNGLELADGSPIGDAPIHMIIGADIYAYTLRDGIIRGRCDEPVAVNTIFGWTLSGNSNTVVDSDTMPTIQVHHMHMPDEDLNSALSGFWEVEENYSGRPISEDDTQCDKYFVDTHKRTRDGHYVVRIPLRDSHVTALGDTRQRALQCLHSMERRLASRPEERTAYEEFMHEYESLGHMKIAPPLLKPNRVVYLRHHSVVKVTSATTKTRIVFNASAVSTSGKSLNDLQLTGQKLQADLPLLHLQWRTYRYVYTADIEKMYRQIKVDFRDVDLQRIMWRRTTSDAVREYQLLTVTYGTSSAPFLALRVLQQLAQDEGDGFPLGKEVLRSHMFVDDALFGADTEQDAIVIRNQTTALLSKGHFTLRKWSSNSATLLADIDPQNHGLSCDKHLQEDESVKILGIAWRPATDSYCFTLKLPSLEAISKQGILSQIARIYDPLGWIAPVVIVAKHLMQLLWSCHAPWDSPVPPDLQSEWDTFYKDLPALADLSIARWLDITPTSRYELHGFCDASMKAYAAVVYVRTELPTSEVKVHLLMAKTRVAPLKQQCIPRLELCGAVILSRLVQLVRSIPAFASCPVQCWTDATIVLAWLKGRSNEWKTFVANRVAEVHSLVPGIQWRHVPGSDNPADIASRGISASELTSSRLWWSGPSWLASAPSTWPSLEPTLSSDAPLERKINAHHLDASVSDATQLFERFSNWPRLCRVLAFCLRLSDQWTSNVAHASRIEELTHVANRVFIICQATPFAPEIAIFRDNQKSEDGARYLQAHQALPRRSSLKRLNPFLDANGLLRVGGRLSLAKLRYNAKFPIILPHSHIARLLARHAHERCLHGDITLTLSTLRTHVWVLQARKLVKSVVNRCVTCARQVAMSPIQMMGSLPPARIQRPIRAFIECGVDYAGPVRLRLASGRGSKSQSAYIALFICMASRAVHLEVVTDYSTDAFLAAFDRFSSRRGLPNIVHSDCGSNFKGADKELRAAYKAAMRSETLYSRMINDEVEWNFIPPAAPHFGGLWEAGVKRHLKRVLEPHTPTYEELATLLCRVEACLNSRPLAPLYETTESLETLTPAHFLVGGPLISAPAPLTVDFTMGRTARWKLYRQLLDHFWTCWSRDYVTSCQHRSRWYTATSPITVGQIVLLRNDNLPPSKWNLARITECFPGHDGLIRVVNWRFCTVALLEIIGFVKHNFNNSFMYSFYYFKIIVFCSTQY